MTEDLRLRQWSVPPMWRGETVFILGGGPGLLGVSVPSIPGPVLAINNAWELAPHADLLYFADRRWYEWNRDALSWFRGAYMVTRSNIPPRDGGPRRKDVVKIDRCHQPLSHDPSKIAGWCSGSNSLNIAYLAGAKEVVLLGFNMTPGNWHNKHRVPQKTSHLVDRFIPSMYDMAKELSRTNMKVYNATPGSALECFPIVHPSSFGVSYEAKEHGPRGGVH